MQGTENYESASSTRHKKARPSARFFCLERKTNSLNTERFSGGLAHLNQSQVYEWLPYNHGEALPVSDEEKHASLWGMAITPETTDGEIVAAKHGFGVRFAKTAARFRSELIARYGEARGKKVRFAEAFELCEYGGQPTPEMEKELFSL